MPASGWSAAWPLAKVPIVSEVLRLEDLTKAYGKAVVLKGIDLTVRRGETVCLIGASGSGKSTLLRCVNFLGYPTSGRIWLEGKLVGQEVTDRAGRKTMRYRESELCAVRTHVGMVFQQFNLFPHMTVEQNVMIAPIKIRGLSKAEARDRAALQLGRVGILEKAKSYPGQLSGGQQQRVAIARALAMEPAIMLFDEATSALDPELVGEVLLAMRQLAQDGTTMLVVTHELGFAYNVAHRVAFLHEGIIHEEGTPEEVLVNPRRPRTQEFLRGVTTFRMPDPKLETTTDHLRVANGGR
jgi:polar amino acid transport system ATP-binding protein